ncbi:MAG: post-transcriptional regulator [Paenibacillaceae bacterium]
MREYDVDHRAQALSDEQLNKVVEELCISKAEEFTMLGYENVTGKEIWECISDRYKKGMPLLHQVVNDILSLKTTQYMNWMTMTVVYKGASLL